MNDISIIYAAEMRESLHIFNRKQFLEDLKQFAGKKLEIVVRLKRKRRTIFQNAYYWGVVVPMVQNALIDLGWSVDKGQTHDFLKDKFWKTELVNEKTGELQTFPGTTTKMTTTEMMEYIADIQRWAAEDLHIYIPDPGEQTQMEFK